MDIGIRFWSQEAKQIEVGYWDSQFIRHATSDDLLENFNKSLVGLNLLQIFQISMDYPGVNWWFYDEVVKNKEEMELYQLINIGSCGLHKIHGSFKTGTEVTDSSIKATVKGAFQILHDSPTRRADYISVSRSNIFFLFFCATKWGEDKTFAERLLEKWSHISKLVAFWLKLPNPKQPKCKSSESVKRDCWRWIKTVKPSFCKIPNLHTNYFIYVDAPNVVQLIRNLMQIL